MKISNLSADLRIALLYALWGGAWILFSDRVLAALVTDPNAVLGLQTYKGWVFVALSALLIFFLLRRELMLHKVIEQKLGESEGRFQTLAQISPVGIFRTEPDGATTYVNPKWCEISGLTAQAALGDGWLRAVHPDDREPLTQGWRASTQQSTASFTEYRFLRPDGTQAWVIGQAIPEINAANQLVGYVGTITDITERKLAETTLQDQERFISAIVNTMPAIVYVYDMTTHSNVYANTGMERLLGYTSHEIQVMGGELHARLVHPDDLTEVAAYQFKVLAAADEDTLEIRYRMQHRNGQWRNFHSFERPFRRYADGRLEQKIGIAVDITERTQAEELVKRERDFSAAMLDSFPGIFYLYDEHLRFLRWNRNFETVSGYTGKEIITMSPLEFFTEEEKLLLAQRIGYVFTQGFADVEANFLAKDGTKTPYYFTGVKVQLGNSTCLLGVGLDITQRKRAEDELHRLNTALEERVVERTEALEAAMHQALEADRLKSAFLATMSHELRTPLNSIIGFTGVLLQGLAGPLNAEQAKQMGMARDSARHLLALINDVLDISKIEAGQLEVRCVSFEMRAAIENALRLVSPQVQKKGLVLTAAIGSGVGGVTSDQRRVEQILLNLLSNAVKFTERGEIRLDCRVQAGFIATSVQDTGIGIRPEDLSKLFEPFRQIETGLNRRHEGTGLGLSISKHLVELLGGQIRVDSEWGVGSTFTFTLPLAP